MHTRRGMGVAVLVVLVIGIAVAIAAVQNGGVRPYDDARPQVVWSGGKAKDLTKVDPAELKKLAPTLWFNQDTAWPDSCKKLAADLMENAKNPGLGVRGLHKSGVTGKGISVAIIDQPLFQDHPEFAGKIVEYKNLCTGEGSDSSMHGPAVASLLVGKTIGTAPGASLYYAAAPSWNDDAATYYAKALDWVLETSAKLPAGSKIRVVSVSAAPSGPGSPFPKNNAKWDAARERADKAGILVLDCTENHGIIGPCYFDGKDVESASTCKPGFPEQGGGMIPGLILTPTAPRTTAEQYDKGVFKYQYTGSGGLSWAIPYAAGVLAMGWQVRPELTKDQMVDLLKKSAYAKDDCKIIDPVEFIKQVRAYK